MKKNVLLVIVVLASATAAIAASQDNCAGLQAHFQELLRSTSKTTTAEEPKWSLSTAPISLTEDRNLTPPLKIHDVSSTLTVDLKESTSELKCSEIASTLYECGENMLGFTHGYWIEDSCDRPPRMLWYNKGKLQAQTADLRMFGGSNMDSVWNLSDGMVFLSSLGMNGRRLIVWHKPSNRWFIFDGINNFGQDWSEAGAVFQNNGLLLQTGKVAIFIDPLKSTYSLTLPKPIVQNFRSDKTGCSPLNLFKGDILTVTTDYNYDIGIRRPSGDFVLAGYIKEPFAAADANVKTIAQFKVDEAKAWIGEGYQPIFSETGYYEIVVAPNLETEDPGQRECRVFFTNEKRGK